MRKYLIVFFLLFLCSCSSGKSDLVLEPGEGFTHPNGTVSFAVYSGEEKEYETAATGSASVTVNGALINANENGRYPLPFNIGTNIVTLGDGGTTLTVKGIDIPAEYGADAAFTRYEAEDAETNGAVSEESREYGTVAAEASGRRYVELRTADDYVTFKLTEPADGFVLRYSIPDAAAGADGAPVGAGAEGMTALMNVLADGEVVGVVELTSRFAWSYGDFPWTNNPADGMPHHYFDDSRIKLGKVLPKGAEVTFKPASEAEFFHIDMLEAELVGEPLPQPEGSVSVAGYGGLPGDGGDDTEALANAIRDAGEAGQTVYIPPGEYMLNSGVYPRGIDIRKPVTVAGAGIWHTVLKGEAAAFYMRTGGVTLRDFSLYGDCILRDDSVYPSAIESDINRFDLEDFRLYNIWIEHQKVGMWVNTIKGIHMAGCRIRNTYADGINLRRGSSYCMIEQNDFRYNGDDAIAGWSAVTNNTGNVIRRNSVSLPWLANGIALYGGADILVTRNDVRDIVDKGAAVNISTNFEPDEFDGFIRVEENYFLRTGSVGYTPDDLHGAVWFNTVEGTVNPAEVHVVNNVMEDSTYYGVNFSGGGEVSNAVIEGNDYGEGNAYPDVDGE